MPRWQRTSRVPFIKQKSYSARNVTEADAAEATVPASVAFCGVTRFESAPEVDYFLTSSVARTVTKQTRPSMRYGLLKSAADVVNLTRFARPVRTWRRPLVPVYRDELWNDDTRRRTDDVLSRPINYVCVH